MTTSLIVGFSEDYSNFSGLANLHVACRRQYRHLFILPYYFARYMMQKRSDQTPSLKPIVSGLTCHFDLKDLVRVDFVFPYGRIAAMKAGVMPEPFDRDAKSKFDESDIQEIRDRISGLFRD